jgi:hypothetical protein
MNDQVNVIVKQENVLYVLNIILFNSSLFFVFWNRIVKVIVKVIDVNVAVLVMYLMDELINVYQQINIDLVPEVVIMLIKNHMIHKV